MCDGCSSRVKHGVAALEALANGEDVPEPPEEPETEVVPVCLPFPVMITATESGFVGIITNERGGKAIRGFLESLGHPPDECDKHH